MRFHSCKRCVSGTVALLLAAAVWLPCVHFLFKRPVQTFHANDGISTAARQLAARHLRLWTDPALRQRELEKMRASNAEWDFMGRSFLVWSLVNMGLREPAAKENYLPVIDQIIDETLKLERERGIYFFLMPYAKTQPFHVKPARSLFLDSEIALMMAARRTLEEKLEPLTLTIGKNAPVYYCFIKTGSQNPVASMEAVKKEMALIEPGQEFNASFVDENINNWYQAEKMMSLLFSIAALVAIVLSCSGLLAMVLLTVQQRVKEIGIRKVLGASVSAIVRLLSKDFLELVVIAILVAAPIAWYLMNNWLKTYEYKINIGFGVFALVIVGSVVVTLLTVSFQAIKAAIANPVESLRTE